MINYLDLLFQYVNIKQGKAVASRKAFKSTPVHKAGIL